MRDFRKEFKNIPPNDWNMIREHPEKWPAWSGAYDESEWEIKEEWVEEVLDALDVCMKERDDLRKTLMDIIEEDQNVIKIQRFTIEELRKAMFETPIDMEEEMVEILLYIENVIKELLKSRGGK